MPQLTIDQAFEMAVKQHRAGALQQAEVLYRQILGVAPQHLGALLNAGFIADTNGRRDIAIDLFRRALAVKPDSVDALAQLGICLGNAGQTSEAIDLLQRAIMLRPGDPQLRNHAGINLARAQEFTGAIQQFDHALKLDPQFLSAMNNLGNALKDSGQNDRAIECFRQLLAIDPAFALGHFNLGNAFKDTGEWAKAIDCYQRAIGINPQFVEALDGLGSCWKLLGDLEKSIDCFQRVIQLRPSAAEAHGNVGVLLADFGKPHDAIAHYRRAVELDPANANARYNLGMELLLVGEFEEGWQLCEARWDRADLIKFKPKIAAAVWDGSDLAGRTILLHAEQGMGDVLQFSRFVPTVIQRGGKVILDCQPELFRLLEHSFADCQVIPRGQRLPVVDAHCALMSLPLVLGTTLQNIPNTVPYLKSLQADSQKWRDRFLTLPPAKNVGLCWAGTRVNPARTIPVSLLNILQQATGARFISLQMDKTDPATKLASATLETIDWTDELKDFADTAALISHLDLVITIDTANAHLAGSLGIPTWVLLPFAADWRWLVDRDDSPWYPTMRLFRQPARGDWGSALSQVLLALGS